MGASPRPRPVCGVCGSGLTASTTSLETNVVDRSVATVQVHADGSATWHVRNQFVNESALAYLRDDSDPEAVDHIVADALEYSTLEGPFHNVSTTFNGSTMRVQFTDPDAARRMPGGVLLVEYLHTHGYDRWLVLTADQLGIRGPNGTTVTNTPPGARIDGRTATWTGNASGQFYDAPILDNDAYVAFADDSIGAGAWTLLAIALATLPTVVTVLTGIHLPPLFAFAIGSLGIGLGGRRMVEGSTLPRQRTIALTVAVIGGLVVATYLLAQIVLRVFDHPLVVTVGMVYLVVGAVAYWRGTGCLRDLLVAGLGTVCGLGLVVGLMLSGEHVTQMEAVQEGLRTASLGLPLLGMVFYGATVVSDTLARSLVGLLVVLSAFFVTELSVVWPTERPFGIVLLVLGVGAVGFTLLGVPLFLLGGLTHDESPSAHSTGQSRAS